MNVSTIVAWGAFWTSKSSQSISKEPRMSPLKLLREPCDALLIELWCIHTPPEPQNLMRKAFSMQV